MGPEITFKPAVSFSAPGVASASSASSSQKAGGIFGFPKQDEASETFAIAGKKPPKKLKPGKFVVTGRTGSIEDKAQREELEKSITVRTSQNASMLHKSPKTLTNDEAGVEFNTFVAEGGKVKGYQIVVHNADESDPQKQTKGLPNTILVTTSGHVYQEDGEGGYLRMDEEISKINGKVPVHIWTGTDGRKDQVMDGEMLDEVQIRVGSEKSLPLISIQAAMAVPGTE